MRWMWTLLTVALVTVPLMAKKPDKANKKGLYGFSKEDRSAIRSTLPPGLQKKVARGGELPPGWAKKLQVGDTLPAKYKPYVETVPTSILKQLPPLHPGEEVVRVENKILKMVKATQLIIDIFEP